MIGQQVSHYRVLGELGVGGMGIVYRAVDARLGREVALKFLPAEFSSQDEAVARFQREAKLASALSHPHICTIHDVGDHNSRPFIVMELLEGRTLKQLVAGQPLPIDRAVELAIEIGEALESAHRRGIVHRDVKPANVFVTRAGHAKVLDFGLAKLIQDWPTAAAGHGSTATRAALPEDELTSPGVQVGTMAYMAPEQARGQAVDARSDIFSFGAVLYEMATGMRAFAGPTPALVLDGILNRTPLSPRYVNPAVPPELERIIERAMEKHPSLRYQGATDLLTDLKRLRRDVEEGRSQVASRITSVSVTPPALTPPPAAGPPAGTTAVDPPMSGRLRPRARLAWRAGGVAALAIVLIAIAVAVAVGRFGSARPEALTDRDSILLADFANGTGDPVFEDTLSQALAVQLSQSPFLDLVPLERVRETLALMGRPRDERLTRATAREACQRLGVKAMLEGSIATLGRLYVVALEATNCQTGESLAREQAEADSKEAVLQALGRAASSLRARLGESLPMIERYNVPIERATTPSLEALKAYTLGMGQRAKGAEVESIPFFQRAIELDPGFAAAHTTLSTVLGSLGEWSRSEEHARRAYALRDRVSERERLFIAYQYHDRVTGDQIQAAEALEVWKQTYPRDFTPPNALSLIFNRLGRFDRAVDEAREAARRHPTHPFPLSNLAYAYRGLNRFDDAKRTAEQAVAQQIETTPTRRLLYQLAVMEGDDAGAARHMAWARHRSREFDMIGAQAQIAAFHGRMREARDLYRRTTEMAVARGFAESAAGYAAHEAWTEALFGNPERALRVPRPPGAGGFDDPNRMVPRFRAVAALAVAGAAGEAERQTRAALARAPDSTLTRTVLAPVTRAAIALRRRDPDRAIEELRAATPSELGTVAGFAPIYLRGQAYLMQGAGPDAAGQFRRILDHRGVDPFSPLYSLSYLGLGRALVSSGNPSGAREAYERFFAVWADADDDLPILREAREEYGRVANPRTN